MTPNMLDGFISTLDVIPDRFDRRQALEVQTATPHRTGSTDPADWLTETKRGVSGMAIELAVDDYHV